ncbi:MAG: DUF262 domain-containing protein [bacterium]|nr:DUF262 domain-containing protein [bacterium]
MAYQTAVSIADTLREIESHEIVLPAIQREFVWQPEQIYNLFDSLMQGYPFGTFLYWKVKQEHNERYQFYDFVLHYHERDRPHCPKIGEMPNRDVVAVLDGQQRLTALNIGIRGSLARKLPYKRWGSDDAFPTLYLHLDLLWSPAEDDDVGMRYRFEFLTREQARDRDGCWFPVADIMTLANAGPAMTRWLSERDLGDQSIEQPHEVLYRLFEVVRGQKLVSFYEEQSQELEKVLQIFIRTNSGGTVLSYSDLLLSVAVAQWTSDAREEIHQLVDDINKIGAGFAFSKDWVLKAGLMLSDIGSVGFKVDNFNRENMAILEKRWPAIKEALVLTVELVSSFGFNGATLRADSALLPIAYYLYSKSARGTFLTHQAFATDRQAIRHWLIASLLKPSGVWGSGLDTLLTALREVIREVHNTFPALEIRETMRARGKSLAFDDDEIDDLTEMRYGDKRTFSLLSLVFRHLDLRQHFHVDHIFPRSRFTPAKLRDQGFTGADADQLRDLADRLPNLQLLEGHENLLKRAAMPTDWLETFPTTEARRNYTETHLLGDLPEALDAFVPFYEARRGQLKGKIATLLQESARFTFPE